MKLTTFAVPLLLIAGCAQTPAPHESAAMPEPSKQLDCTAPSTLIYFESWSSEITPAARELLNFLQQTNDHCNPSKIYISAYGDAEGSAADNLALTQKRAEAVRAELIKMGATSDMIVLNPKGQEGAVRADGKPRPSHRYAEIKLIP